MASRAPKQWCLTKHETINSFENWRQNLQYTLSLDANFTPFMIDGSSWGKKSKGSPLRGFKDDADPERTSVPRRFQQTWGARDNGGVRQPIIPH